MSLQTGHSIDKGMYRLLHAPQDLAAAHPVAFVDPATSRAQASPQHAELFAEYKEWLEGAIFFAVERWEGMIQMREQRGMSRDSAIDDLYKHALAGPAACPQLVWTLREFWLRCAALNRELPDRAVAPQVFLLGWVADEGGHDEWVQVMTAMPYWPIGLDEHGEWC